MYGKKEAPAIRILQEAGEDVGRLEYAFTERGGTKDAARQLGLCEHDIVKSLVFDDGQGGHAVMALMHGDERVSLHKLQRLFERGTLYINAGERGVIAVIRPDALRLAGAVAGDIQSCGPRR